MVNMLYLFNRFYQQVMFCVSPHLSAVTPCYMQCRVRIIVCCAHHLPCFSSHELTDSAVATIKTCARSTLTSRVFVCVCALRKMKAYKAKMAKKRAAAEQAAAARAAEKDASSVASARAKEGMD
uniref:Uncharacterized protein n=1 Tax=Lotharella globosa TaxID=91324 RepID=A0A7S4DPV9_9EUKA